MHGKTATRRRLLAAVGTGALAGCIGYGSADGYVLAAAVLDDPADVARDYEPLAAWIEAETGVETRIDAVQDDGAAVAALAAGRAHAAYLSGGPAWVGWQRHDLSVLAVEVDDDGRTHYVATAWVRAGEGLESLSDLEGVDSCHTGELAGAGMLMPMARLAAEGLVEFTDDDDITAVRGAAETYFGNPLVGGGYVGALQCLSRGHGDVAFVRDTSPETYCGGSHPESWCLDLSAYEVLAELAAVPSHPFMTGPATDADDRRALRAALLALNDDPGGEEILEDVLGVAGLEAAESADHLGSYGELLDVLPGIEDHLLG